MATNPIYLDHNATTPLLPQAAEAMARWYRTGGGNPASPHSAGRKARQALDNARDSIAAILGADCGSSQADRVVFTSGGTEANNLALRGLCSAEPGHLIVSAIEHPSVQGVADDLRRRGHQVDTLGVSGDGVIDVAALPALLRSDTRLVSLMLGNNETGVLQPIERAAQLCAARGVTLHTDAVQVIGKLPVDFRRLGVSAMAVSAHKFHGPVGIGALVLRAGTTLRPLLHGGFQQEGLRPGTEPVALAIGFEAALLHWHQQQSEILARLTGLRDAFEAELLAGWPNLVVNGRNASRLPYTSNVAFPGLDRQVLVMALDLAGVACSTGSACASGSSEPSPTLVAMRCAPEVLGASLRFSFGQQTTAAEVHESVGRILKICNDLQAAKRTGKKSLAGTG